MFEYNGVKNQTPPGIGKAKRERQERKNSLQAVHGRLLGILVVLEDPSLLTTESMIQMQLVATTEANSSNGRQETSRDLHFEKDMKIDKL